MNSTVWRPRPESPDAAVRFLCLEPFYGGSHRDFAQGLVKHSRHQIELVTLPARFWKWRMRGAALHFFHQIADVTAFDGLVTSALMSLADFTALCGGRRPPALVYFHESQLTYPLAPGERMDLQFGFTDITTALCADRVLFNSHFHRDRFFEALPGFIGRMPEFRPRWAIQAIREKSGVLWPGCDFDHDDPALAPLLPGPPLVIWNHRWEFDKNPEAFFAALDGLLRQGVAFRLAVLGVHFKDQPPVFAEARARFGDRVVQFGFVDSRPEYVAWLKRGCVVVSTAIQENFGIAVVEAVRHGCLPLLPNRLSYPEIIPERWHARFLYHDDDDLVNKLAAVLRNPDRFDNARRQLAEAMARHAWPLAIGRYDRELDRLAAPHPS